MTKKKKKIPVSGITLSTISKYLDSVKAMPEGSEEQKRAKFEFLTMLKLNL